MSHYDYDVALIRQLHEEELTRKQKSLEQTKAYAFTILRILQQGGMTRTQALSLFFAQYGVDGISNSLEKYEAQKKLEEWFSQALHFIIITSGWFAVEEHGLIYSLTQAGQRLLDDLTESPESPKQS